MSTVAVPLVTTEYTLVSTLEYPLLLQAHRDAVRLVYSDTKPPASTPDFHLLRARTDPFLVGRGVTLLWAKATSASSSLMVSIQAGVRPAENNDTKSLRTDAWSRPKVVYDVSLFHGMFTFNIPGTTWYESTNDVEAFTFTNATSVDGKLVLASAALNDRIGLRTFRCMRYEPNRGHLYSTSIFLPDPNATAERSFGIFTPDAGVFFRLRDGVLYGVTRTTINSVTTDVEEVITVPSGIDLSKGNLFDIQFQWRGVGEYFFYINQQLVYVNPMLGTRTELSIFNPSLPVAYEVINQGSAAEIHCGCVDVTSEGGEGDGKTYGSISISTDSGAVNLANTVNAPLLAIRNKRNYGGLTNTRSVTPLRSSVFAESRTVVKIWFTRVDAAITENDQVWQDYGDGHLEYLEYDNPNVTTPFTFNPGLAVLLYQTRLEAHSPRELSALFEGNVFLHHSPGTIVVFTAHAVAGGGVTAGATYQFAEEI